MLQKQKQLWGAVSTNSSERPTLPLSNLEPYVSVPHCQTHLPKIPPEMHFTCEVSSLQIKASPKSFFLAPKISRSELRVILMSKCWRREDCTARSTLECPSGHGRGQEQGAQDTSRRPGHTERGAPERRRGLGRKRVAAHTKTQPREWIHLCKARGAVPSPK